MNKRFSKMAGLAAKTAVTDASFFDKAKAFSRLVPAAFSGKYKANKKNLVISGLAFAYIISPLDFIPAIVAGPIGILDDAAIFMFGIKYLNKEIVNFMEWEKLIKENIIPVEVIENK